MGDSQQYDIGVLIGASTFRFYKFLDLGKIKLCKGLEDTIQIKGKIIDFQVDQQNDSGFYFTMIERSDQSSARQSQASYRSSVYSDESLKQQKKLMVLIDRVISDITPIDNFDFIEENSNFTIAMQYSGGKENLNKFGIVLESVSEFDSMVTK